MCLLLSQVPGKTQKLGTFLPDSDLFRDKFALLYALFLTRDFCAKTLIGISECKYNLK